MAVSIFCLCGSCELAIIPTSHNTHKYRNLLARPRAYVMIDISRAGLNLKGVLIRGRVELVRGEKSQQINRSIHLKYVTSDALNDPNVASYLSKGDDVTVNVHMDRLISWNLSDSKASTSSWCRWLVSSTRRIRRICRRIHDMSHPITFAFKRSVSKK